MQEHTLRSRGRALAVGAVLLAAGLAGGVVMARSGYADERNGQRPAQRAAQPTQAARQAPLPNVGALADLESAFIAIAERLEPSVVSIRVDRRVSTTAHPPIPDDMEELFRGFGFGTPRQFRIPRQFRVSGAGSGVIVRRDGWILTNDHVVNGADKVTVRLSDGRELPGTVRRDFRSDLALVKINASNLVPAELGESGRVRVGQWAIAFGSPFELDQTMTLGIVSAVSRHQTVGLGPDQRYYPSLIQTDAAINPGNSGGPLVDIRGRVIGINVAIASPTGGNVGVGFAIPVDTARHVMEQLITRGKVTRGFLGVMPRDLEAAERQRYGVSQGVLIQSVTEGSPAAKAGVQVEDVVVRYNGQPVTSDAQFRDLVARTAPGSKVEIVVRRGGREVTLTPTVESAPELTAQSNPQAAEPARGKLGVRVEAINPETARRFNLGSQTAGVVVVEVLAGSPAEEAGIQPGDVILRANGRDIKTPADLQSATQSAKSGDRIPLVVHRDKARTLVSVEIP